jgi:hypothetical protein
MPPPRATKSADISRLAPGPRADRSLRPRTSSGRLPWLRRLRWNVRVREKGASVAPSAPRHTGGIRCIRPPLAPAGRRTLWLAKREPGTARVVSGPLTAPIRWQAREASRLWLARSFGERSAGMVIRAPVHPSYREGDHGGVQGVRRPSRFRAELAGSRAARGRLGRPDTMRSPMISARLPDECRHGHTPRTRARVRTGR